MKIPRRCLQPAERLGVIVKALSERMRNVEE